MAQRVTATQFGYDGLWKKLRNSLKQFKEKCANVVVVFDGVSKPNEHRRTDPERASSVKFNDDGCVLPALLRDEFLLILHNLEIQVYVSSGEADPTIVKMARKHNAYIVARDSDYYLYEIQKGYVPLPDLALSTLEGQYYHMRDVFQDMTQRSVALWATTIAFDFIDLEVLQNQVSMINASDKRQFNHWLANIASDDEKRRRLICQFCLLRYIQELGETTAYNNLITLFSEDKLEFNQVMQSYVNLSSETPLLTQNGNEIPEFLNELYTNGKLDRAVIDILVTRQVLHLWQGTNIVHFNLLLPMCHILLTWDYSKSNSTNLASTVIFNEQTYNPLELIQSDDLPLLAEFVDLDESKRKGFILGCVDFALKPLESINWDGVHRDYKLWLCLLKLWLHTKEIKSVVLEATCLAMIVTFLKHSLLDTYDETEGNYHNQYFCKEISHSSSK
ncbi:unnamed protein product [Rotaria sp. Silwood2]|nr:unnamed protein product [Rotaria sp. Silwood2]CAF4210981.1 unnamed protein product [Rotaria sp. Silwood2]